MVEVIQDMVTCPSETMMIRELEVKSTVDALLRVLISFVLALHLCLHLLLAISFSTIFEHKQEQLDSTYYNICSSFLELRASAGNGKTMCLYHCKSNPLCVLAPLTCARYLLCQVPTRVFLLCILLRQGKCIEFAVTVSRYRLYR